MKLLKKKFKTFPMGFSANSNL